MHFRLHSLGRARIDDAERRLLLQHPEQFHPMVPDEDRPSSAPDQHFKNQIDSAARQGKHVFVSGPSAYITSDKNEVAWRDYVDGKGPMPTSFRPRSAADTTVGKFVDRSLPVARPSPYHYVDAYGRMRYDEAALQRDANVERFERQGAEFVGFVREQDNALNAELSKLLQRAAVLRDGSHRRQILALVAKYQQMRAHWGKDVDDGSKSIEADFRNFRASKAMQQRVWDIPANERPYFAAQMYRDQRARTELPGMVASLHSDVEALVKQLHAETQELFVDAMVQWQQFEGLRNNPDIHPEELRAMGMAAIAAIDRLGSHLYASHSQDIVTPDITDAAVAAAKKALDGRGIVVGADFERTVRPIPADRNGIQELLKIKTDVLARLDEKLALSDLNLRQARVLAIRRERRYLIEQGGRDADRLAKLTEDEMFITGEMIRARKALTDAVPDDRPDEKLRLAQHELHFLQSFAPADAEGKARMKELSNRDPAAPGIIQKARLAMIDAERAENDELMRPLADPYDRTPLTSGASAAQTALQNVRAEGLFLFRYRNELPLDAEERMKQLVGLQHQLLVEWWNFEIASADGSPERMASVVEGMEKEFRKLQISKDNLSFLESMVPVLMTYVRGDLRTAVNEAVAAARNADPKNADDRAAKVQTAIAAVAAERRVLTLLRVDPDRLTSVERELSLVAEVGASAESRLEALETGLPEFRGFNRALAAVDAEESAMKTAFGSLSPDQRRTLDGRRAKVFELLSKNVDAAVKAMSSKRTNVSVGRANDFVQYELTMRGGGSMTDTQRYTTLMGYQDSISKAVEELREEEAAARAKKAEGEAARDAAKAEEERAEREAEAKEDVERAERMKPLTDAELLLAEIEEFLEAVDHREKNPAPENVGETLILLKAIERLDGFVERLHAADIALMRLQQEAEKLKWEDVPPRVALWNEWKLEVRARLDRRLQEYLVRLGTRDAIERAAHVFMTRYLQLRTEQDVAPADPLASGTRLSGETREELIAEMEGPRGLLARAVYAGIDNAVLHEIERAYGELKNDASSR